MSLSSMDWKKLCLLEVAVPLLATCWDSQKHVYLTVCLQSNARQGFIGFITFHSVCFLHPSSYLFHKPCCDSCNNVTHFKPFLQYSNLKRHKHTSCYLNPIFSLFFPVPSCCHQGLLREGSCVRDHGGCTVTTRWHPSRHTVLYMLY